MDLKHSSEGPVTTKKTYALENEKKEVIKEFQVDQYQTDDLEFTFFRAQIDDLKVGLIVQVYDENFQIFTFRYQIVEKSVNLYKLKLLEQTEDRVKWFLNH